MNSNRLKFSFGAIAIILLFLFTGTPVLVTSSAMPLLDSTEVSDEGAESTETSTPASTEDLDGDVDATNTPTLKPTDPPTATSSPEVSPTVTPSVDATNTPTLESTDPPTATPSPEVSPSVTPYIDATNTPTLEPTGTPSATPSQTVTATPSQTVTATPSQTVTATPTTASIQEPLQVSGEGWSDVGVGQGEASVESVSPSMVNVASLPQVSGPAEIGTAPIPVPLGEPPDEVAFGEPPEEEQVPSGGDVFIDNPGSAPGSNAPMGIRNWEGPKYLTDSGYIPPDPIIAAGPQHVVVNINSWIGIYDRLGNKISGTSASNWYSGVGLPSGSMIFDPRILYDRLSNRWIMVWVAIKSSTNQSWFMVSCSQTSDPTGSWYNYALDATLNGSTPTTNWADYPRHGVTNNAIVLSANMFGFSSGFQYTKVRILNKSTICSGGAAGWWDQWGMQNENGSNVFTMVPAHQYDDVSPMYMINSDSGSDNYLSLWQIADVLNWTSPSSGAPAFARIKSTVYSYSTPPDADQPGGVQDLDNVGTRMLHAVFQNDNLYAVHTTSLDCSGRVGSAWKHYQFGNVTTAPSLVEDGTFCNPSADYFYPSIAVDGAGNVVVGFAASGPSYYGSARYTGELQGTWQGSAECAGGVDTYLLTDGYGRNRWGDYSGVEIAPDLSTFYVFNEYVGAQNIWYTRICAVFYKQRTPVDYNIDGESDIVVFSGGAWQHFDFATGNYLPGSSVWTGTTAGCIPAPMDYDGDGRMDYTQLCGGAWHFYNNNGTYNKGIWVGGVAGDVPVPADYDGDGTDEVVVFSGGAWQFFDFDTGNYLPGSSVWTGAPPHWTGGTPVPVPMDYDGDGTADYSVYSGGPWHFFNDNGSYNKGIWTGAVAGDIPVSGDYDGDGTEDVVVFSGGAWQHFDFATGNYLPGSSVWTGQPPHWTGVTSLPAPLDYDGDGELDYTVYSGGPWHFFNDNGSYNKGIWTGGAAGDQGLSRRLLP